MNQTLTAYLAFPDFLPELETEILRKKLRVVERWKQLLLVEGPSQPMIWAQNTWFNPEWITFDSIGGAAKALRDRGRNWALYSFQLHRRASLIQAQLPKLSAKPVPFLAPLPNQPMGAFVLVDANRMLASATTNHPYPLGIIPLEENKEEPPSRAYLKLWELFTVENFFPKPNAYCIDLGSAPGGWTWVLAKLGARVVSIDKAPLAPNLLKFPNVEYRSESAFALGPDVLGPVDWLFSDVICYPDRLLKLVERWLAAKAAKNFVCTIKFQGSTDFTLLDQFAAIPGSHIRHLSQNKHEVTWFLLDETPSVNSV